MATSISTWEPWYLEKKTPFNRSTASIRWALFQNAISTIPTNKQKKRKGVSNVTTKFVDFLFFKDLITYMYICVYILHIHEELLPKIWYVNLTLTLKYPILLEWSLSRFGKELFILTRKPLRFPVSPSLPSWYDLKCC